MVEPRQEATIFEDLVNLCSSKGYAHVIAHFCHPENFFISDGKDIDEQSSNQTGEKMIRLEITTLIGLLVKNHIDLSLPSPNVMKRLIGKTNSLLSELHRCLSQPMFAPRNNFSGKGEILREAIFYGGESAFDFQYLELSSIKYKKDDPWMISNKGFSTSEMIDFICAVLKVHSINLNKQLERLLASTADRTMLPGFIFDFDELCNHSSLCRKKIKAILNEFCFPSRNRNCKFKSISDINCVNARPIIKVGKNKYLLFQDYNLLESAYESPYYWMIKDSKYAPVAMHNRGNFTENVSAEMLKKVFGEKGVLQNVKIYNPCIPNKAPRSEIDVLVIFGDNIIIFQIKGKKLTLDARKGNDEAINDDFKKGVQNAYDQGLLCAELIQNKNYQLIDSNSNVVKLPIKIKVLYPVCVVSDHYPALSAQCRQLLKYKKTDTISPPFVMDLFLLDILTDFLDSPLYFISYIKRRSQYENEFIAPNELTLFSYHLKVNLWKSKDTQIVLIDASFAQELHFAFNARRLGTPGDKIPIGILTWFNETIFSDFINKIKQESDPDLLNLGLVLLMLDEGAIREFSNAISLAIERANNSGRSDFNIAMEEIGSGFTIHCNSDPTQDRKRKLRQHCILRKYKCKANSWCGLSIDLKGEKVLAYVYINEPWKKSDEIELAIKKLRG